MTLTTNSSAPFAQRVAPASFVIGAHGLLLVILFQSAYPPAAPKKPVNHAIDALFFLAPILTPQQPQNKSPGTSPQARQAKPRPRAPISNDTKTAQTPPNSAPVTTEAPKPILRNIAALSAALARESKFEQDKIQAAKPPNQLVREYWEAHNHPYKDKWDELAQKVEKAGKPRGITMETYTTWDGTQITKINGVCYKAPDPGRTYLHQPEARPVICPR